MKLSKQSSKSVLITEKQKVFPTSNSEDNINIITETEEVFIY